VFVAANAGSGKTSTLVKRVARLLLDGARPEAILCVTYTKAGAAEMQRRLFETLGEWAVAPDEKLELALAEIAETGRELSKARALFARALETPGGLKIQTIHAFCEKLLRRFPLEAGVSPGFVVLEDVAAAEVSTRARDRVAEMAMNAPDGAVARAYAHFSVQLDWGSFNDMFAAFEARRGVIADWVATCAERGGFGSETWRLCGFAEPEAPREIEAEALSAIDWDTWKRVAETLLGGAAVTDRDLGAAMAGAGPDKPYEAASAPFFTKAGGPKARLGTKAVAQPARDWLADEQTRHVETRQRLAAASMAEETVHALTLAITYAAYYEDEKASRGALDFSDLIGRVHNLLSEREDAQWVLYKLDGGLEHILLDEAQDTAPEQWDILRALAEEFFSGAGARPRGRTVFAVGDEKQSIFSFQGAAPERLAAEAVAFGDMADGAGMSFSPVELLESWRSTPEILSFVDTVFKEPAALAGLRPARNESGGDNQPSQPISHIARREPAGCVELWPLERNIPGEAPSVWDPVDSEGPTSAAKLLAGRIARAVAAMVTRGDGVLDRQERRMRPCVFGDVLILVRRRSNLFHEIIRALKREGAPVAGADRLKLSEHGVFQDLIALASFACFPADDLVLAGLLRSPFCDVDEESLFDLAFDRRGSLWGELLRRAGERSAWGAAADRLNWVRAEAERAAPFDFYSRFLGRLDEAGRSMRQRLLTRLGAEGEEALDAFLSQTLDAEGRGQRDLETFVAAMAASDIDIKREPEQARGRGDGEVRVMTVHGAKGLEAPIVILPDTTTRATAQAGPLLGDNITGLLWAPRKGDDCAASTAAREAREKATDHESARLLYVALTRARDRLIVCGVESQKARFERSWYDFVNRAFDESSSHAFAVDGETEGRRHGVDPTTTQRVEIAATAPATPPSWATRLAPAEPDRTRYASPSSLGDASVGRAPSPLAAVGGLGRYRRGDLIHRLLQLLPDLPDDQWTAGAARILGRERDLTDSQRAEMAGAALTVLGDPRFAAVFGAGSRAEVAIAGAARRLPPGLAISGRVDRLVLENDRVLIVDFKSNRPAPPRVEQADPAYVLQMAIYAAVLAEVYPERKVEAVLVWTDGPSLMPVPESMMREALEGLAIAG
jgi:ATP-dependent helicase/nuclease subunit A